MRESLRKTLIEDSSKGYSCTKDRDTLGRLSQVTLRLSGGHVAFTMKLSYNERGQVSARSTAVSGGSRGKVNTFVQGGSSSSAQIIGCDDLDGEGGVHGLGVATVAAT